MLFSLIHFLKFLKTYFNCNQFCNLGVPPFLYSLGKKWKLFLSLTYL